VAARCRPLLRRLELLGALRLVLVETAAEAGAVTPEPVGQQRLEAEIAGVLLDRRQRLLDGGRRGPDE
jgi:hypothetical protein